MNNFTISIDDLKAQAMASLADMAAHLTDAVRGALETGFELVAGTAGAKIAKSVECAVNDVKAAEATGDMRGLRDQIWDNCAVLLPLAGKCVGYEPAMHVITTGTKHTGGTRAMILEVFANAKPKILFWSGKHPTPTLALADLLNITQGHLKTHVARLSGAPSPILGHCDEFTSFNAGIGIGIDPEAVRPRDDDDDNDDEMKAKLFWDANTVTNPSFEKAGGFDYASFETSDSDDDTYAEAASTVKGSW